MTRIPITSVFLASIIFVALGCNSSVNHEYFESAEFGLGLNKPQHWEARYHERSNSITVQNSKKVWTEASSLIEIFRIRNSKSSVFLEETLVFATNRLSSLYDLDSIETIDELTKVGHDEYEIAFSAISIPTMSLPKQSVANQMGEQKSSLYQLIELRLIRCNSNAIIVYTYYGTNEKLNGEAQDIVGSIKLTCSL